MQEYMRLPFLITFNVFNKYDHNRFVCGNWTIYGRDEKEVKEYAAGCIAKEYGNQPELMGVVLNHNLPAYP